MSPLLRALAERHRLRHIDESDIEGFFDRQADEPSHALLFFPGDASQKAETDDVAVVFPELAARFDGHLRAAVITQEACEALKSRFQVQAVPCLVVTRDRDTVGVIPRIRDWSEYIAMIDVFLKPGTKAMKPHADARELSAQGADL